MDKLIDFILKNYKNFDVTIESQGNDSIVITMKKINKKEIENKIKEFNEYVKNIDDDFFTDICDIFNGTSGINVNEFSKILSDANDLEGITKYTDTFKNITKEFVKEHIKMLENKYF